MGEGKEGNACPQIGLSRLCSATFEQLLAFGATFCGFSNLEQVLPFRAVLDKYSVMHYTIIPVETLVVIMPKVSNYTRT